MQCWLLHLNGDWQRARNSIDGCFDEVRIFDNSLALPKMPSIFHPPVEFSVSQAYNYIHKNSIGDYYVIMHDDGIADKPLVSTWIERSINSKVRWWESNIRALALYKRSVIEEIGPWDQMFYFYFMDFDYFIRASKKGYTTLKYPELEEHFAHEYGSTMNRDPKRKAYHKYLWDYQKALFEAKWGSMSNPYPYPFNNPSFA